MLNIDRILRQDRLLRATTGLNRKAFKDLLVKFTFERSQANRWVHRLQPILEKSLGEKKVLPLRRLSSIDEFPFAFPDSERSDCRRN